MNETINLLVDQSNGKFKSQGDFDLFKELVEDILKITGKWTSPRGSCKQIKTANITLRLYENGSVLLEGPMVDEYRKILEQLAMISLQKELNMRVGDVECTPPHLPSLQNNYYFNKFMVSDSLSCLNNSNLSEMAQQEKADESHVTSSNLSYGKSIKITEETIGVSSLRDVARWLDSLTDRFEKHKTESSIVVDVITTLEVLKNSNSTDYIAQENISLKRENNLLKEELDNLKCVVSELSRKLTAAENDKASLLTAIRLLNDDRAFNHANVNNPINSNQVNQTANLWHAATSSSNSKSNSSQQQPLPLKNKYSVLRVEDDENSEKNEDKAAKQVRETGQSTGDKSSVKESAFNKKRGVTKEQKLIRSLSVIQ